MNNASIKNEEEGRRDVDGLLKDFFQAQMPKPWPSFRFAPSAPPRIVASIWSRSMGRLALAACVALLIGSYLSLSSFFPQVHSPTTLDVLQPNIGMKSKSPDTLPKSSTSTPAIIDDGNGRIILEPMGVQSAPRKSS